MEHYCGLPEKTVLDILYDVSSGIKFLHGLKIYHRDLKPENILVMLENKGPVYKIADLGYAKQLEDVSICNTLVGTLYYLVRLSYAMECAK